MIEIIEHTADIGLKVKSSNLNEAFREAALGMMSLMVQMDKVDRKDELHISESSDSNESLLVRFLNDLLYHFEADNFVFSDVDISVKNYELEAKLYGEKYDRARHGSKLLIKAVTYHMLKVDENGEIFVIFDI
ncbi:MAG: archease [Thermoplasmata archaeon]